MNIYKTRYPLGRAGECDDRTAVIEYLISDSASFKTDSNGCRTMKIVLILLFPP